MPISASIRVGLPVGWMLLLAAAGQDAPRRQETPAGPEAAGETEQHRRAMVRQEASLKATLAKLPPIRALPKAERRSTLRVNPPDILIIEVLEALPGRPLQGERLVRSDGTVSLGYYGDLRVAGLTLPEIKAKVIEHLRTHLNAEALGLVRFDGEADRFEPVAPEESDRVYVDIAAYHSHVYYVLGEIVSPGRLPWTGEESVLDVIQYGRGLTPDADPSAIRVVRRNPDGSIKETIAVDYRAISEGKDLRTNVKIFEGDMLIVPRRERPKAVAPTGDRSPTPPASGPAITSVGAERK